MSKIKVLWSGKPSFKRVIFFFGDTDFRHPANWKFNKSGPHFNIISPLLRITKCNGQFEIGLGNYYILIGW
jgi:hypothetical protein